MASISMTVNGDLLDISHGMTVASFLEGRKIDPRLVVVEYNREIIEREKYGETILKSGDEIEIVRIVGGG